MPEPTKSPPANSRPLWVIAISLSVIAACLVMMVITPKLRGDDSRTSQAMGSTDGGEKFSKAIPSTRSATSVKPTHSSGSSRTNTTPAPIEIQLNQTDVTANTVTSVFPVFAGRVSTNTRSSSMVADAATITGRVTLRGSPPAETIIQMPELSPCALLQTNTHTTHLFNVGADNGLADVLITIQRFRGGGFPIPRPASRTVKIGFVNCEIVPAVNVVTHYEQVVFENADNVMHTPRINSTNRPPRTSLALSLPAMASRQVSGIIPTELFMPVTCDDHPWEKATLSVVPHPIFALTDANGNFTITNVPPGRYVLRALHQGVSSTNGLIREVMAGRSETVPLNFVVDAPGS
jgi:hypothetical protein